MVKSNYFQGLIFLILAQAMVAINIVASKFLLTTIPIYVLLTMRFVLAAAILFPLHWLTPAKQYSIRHHFSSLNKKDWIFLIAQALTAGILFNGLMLLGLHYTNANAAGIITSALPAIIAIMSWIILGETISRKKGICIVIATLGLLTITADQLRGIQLNHSFLGDLIILLSLIPEASYYILSKLHSVKLPVFLLTALLNGINGFILLCLLPIVPFHVEAISLSYWLIILVLGLSSGFFYVFWYFGCQRVDSVMTSLSTAVMPVITVILAGIVLSESISIGQIIGMSMVILSIGLYAKR